MKHDMQEMGMAELEATYGGGPLGDLFGAFGDFLDKVVAAIRAAINAARRAYDEWQAARSL